MSDIEGLAAAVADEVAARFSAGWPMTIPPEVAADLAEFPGVTGMFQVGAGPWSYYLEYRILTGGRLHLLLRGRDGIRAWEGTLTREGTHA